MDDKDRRALVIETNDRSRAGTIHTLSMQGFDVDWADSGHRGVEMAGDIDPDLITIAVDLPDLDGIEVCRRIRESSDAYIVLISTHEDELERLMGLEIGADDFLNEPFNPRELQVRVSAMFRRPRKGPASRAEVTFSPRISRSFRHGTLKLDVNSRIVTVLGTEARLTKTEFDLLAMLLSNPTRVWSREVLMAAVWGGGWVKDTHVVEVHVGNLRRKLNRLDPDTEFIHTVRGVGYRMDSQG